MSHDQIMAIHGTVAAACRFAAHLYALTHEEGGRHTPSSPTAGPSSSSGTTDVAGITTVNTDNMVMPGDSADLTFEFGQSVTITAAQEFAVREGKKPWG